TARPVGPCARAAAAQTVGECERALSDGCERRGPEQAQRRSTDAATGDGEIRAEPAHVVAEPVDGMRREERAVVQRAGDGIDEAGLAAAKRCTELTAAVEPDRFAHHVGA